ncbi:MAG: hypothetical protein ITG01_06690 [Comamonas sp.]|jgi:hypothetical protein|nr:hypothetical protein [Comamonas sp.]
MQPLDLTVHNPPSVHSLSEGAHTGAIQRSGRWKMLLVLLVCAAPVVASYFTYYVIRPEARRNFGELIEPQRAMPAGLMATTLAGDAVPLHSLQGQWLLISTAPAACGAQCEQQLYLQRQLREGLGREKERLDWVWLIHDGQAPAPALQPALASAQVLSIPHAQLQSWLQPAAGQQLQDHLYVVDPQGNWMLRFPANLDSTNASKAKRDLERLLRASSSWDQAGR